MSEVELFQMLNELTKEVSRNTEVLSSIDAKLDDLEHRLAKIETDYSNRIAKVETITSLYFKRRDYTVQLWFVIFTIINIIFDLLRR